MLLCLKFGACWNRSLFYLSFKTMLSVDMVVYTVYNYVSQENLN